MQTRLYGKMEKLVWLLTRQHLAACARSGPLADPAFGQGRILHLLQGSDGISTRALAQRLDIRVSSLNELLAKMEKNGYIVRRPSSQDRRVMLVYRTPKACRLPGGKCDPGGVFDGFSPQELQRFDEYLDRVIAALSQRLEQEKRAAQPERERPAPGQGTKQA